MIPSDTQAGAQPFQFADARSDTLRYLVLSILALISLGLYLVASERMNSPGFPLDDAWIHQTYARNLAEYGEWAFQRGTPSSGSTAPLWSAILAIGYWLDLGPYLWTFFIGWLILWCTAIVAEKVFRALLEAGDNRNPEMGNAKRQKSDRLSTLVPWGGLVVILEWHLVWAAGSGMETLAYACLVLWIIYMLMKNDYPSRIGGGGKKRLISWLSLGILIGISTWLRPDGVILWGPVGLVWLLWKEKLAIKLRIAIMAVCGFGLLFIPYLVFNRFLAGGWWPNTFYAKQAEYAVYRNLPFWQRLFSQAGLVFIGVNAVLAPGLITIAIRLYRQGRWIFLVGLLWAAGYLAIYAWRLPVTYQHGRYIMPVMPVITIIGLAGMVLQVQTGVASLFHRVLYRSWVISTFLVLLIFWYLGAQAYTRDVAVINGEMVTTAHWVANHTRPGALIAAHDIGALGYFGARQLIDLAGLVSPEVIPFIRDEQALQAFLNSRHAEYLVTFPSWYPNLTDQLPILFQTPDYKNGTTPREPFVVFRWHSP